MTTINLCEYDFIKKGAFADVLINKSCNKALKLFISYNHSRLDGTGKEEIGKEKTNNYRKKVFKTELEAYELANKSEILKNFIPTFYGQVKFEKILNND